ncbi:hypothetical protein FACS1894122_03750 [Alphaproteobacteria bacterium]|nr:hypothetical protein FACS1894122_03750 [Alphaproteobacteria bacterium]
MNQLLKKIFAFVVAPPRVTLAEGGALAETAITLPVFLILMFFMLETIKVYMTKVAIESIAAEATFVFIEEKSAERFNDIIDKHRPAYIPHDSITWHFSIYENLETMCNVPPYGAEDIYWYTPNSVDKDTYLTSGGSGFIERAGHMANVDDITPESTFPKKSDLVGKAFVLTFVCDYQFSSPYVKIIFNGGTNTADKKKYLLWGRGCGICSSRLLPW